MVLLPPLDDGLEKMAGKLPDSLRQSLKIRCAQLDIAVQEAVAEALTAWQSQPEPLPSVRTGTSVPFSTWLPPGLYDEFRADCREQGVSYTQGLAQAVTLWLGGTSRQHRTLPARTPIRTAVCHPGHGSGKTTLASGLARVLAWADQRVLLVDLDPEGRLTRSAGLPVTEQGQESLVTHLLDRRATTRPLTELIRDVPVGPHSAGQVRLLPAAVDAYLLDSGLARLREPRQAVLERVLTPLEAEFDAVVVDCPSNLGMSVEAALFYARFRADRSSGIAVPVGRSGPTQGRDLLISLIGELAEDWQVPLVHQVVRFSDRTGRPVEDPPWLWRRRQL